jgi:glycine oxidase
MVLADSRTAPVRLPVFAGDTILLPRADGSFLLGVTIEETGFDDRVTLQGVQAILEQVSRLVPGAASLGFGKVWAGLRPATADGLPYLGRLTPLRNLWVSTGHFRKGILLAPLCARLLARSILHDQLDDALAPFKPTRRPAGAG